MADGTGQTLRYSLAAAVLLVALAGCAPADAGERIDFRTGSAERPARSR